MITTQVVSEIEMRILRNTISWLCIAVLVACHDTSAPPGFPANYVLARVNGAQLPAPLGALPESPIVLDGILVLDGSGNATETEHQQVMVAPANRTITGNYTYTIKDNTIQFHSGCLILAVTTTCGTVPLGTFVGTHLVIDISGSGNGPVYDYQLAVSD